jgi:hypothetical protein
MLHRSGLPHQDSPLRQARKARNWTLERLVEEIDLRTPGGHSGVTPSMVSGWELGRHTTSTGQCCARSSGSGLMCCSPIRMRAWSAGV